MENSSAKRTICLVVPDSRPALLVEYTATLVIRGAVNAGLDITVLFEKRGGSQIALSALAQELDVKTLYLDEFKTRYWTGEGLQSNFKSHYQVLEFLKENAYDQVVAPDHKGLLYYSILAKRQKLAFAQTEFVSIAVSSTLASILGSDKLINYLTVLGVAYLERRVCELADNVLSTESVIAWMLDGGYDLDQRTTNTLNVVPSIRDIADGEPEEANERKTDQKLELNFIVVSTPEHVLNVFLKALQRGAEIVERFPVVNFYLYDIDGDKKKIGKALKESLYKLNFMELTCLSDLRQSSNSNSLTVLYQDKSTQTWLKPYLDTLTKNYIYTQAPATANSLEALSVDSNYCQLNPDSLVKRIGSAQLTSTGEGSLESYLHPTSFDLAAPPLSEVRSHDSEPLVSICVVHHERPDFLRRALDGFSQQTYSNIELIVIDDGSKSASTKQALKEIENDFGAKGWQFIYQDNKWLGAARNEAARNAKGEYLVFFDDDNIPLPHFIETYVKSIQATDSDLMTCFQLSFVENEYQDYPNFFPKERNVIIPIGGAGAIGQFDNFYGDASCIVKRSVFKELGGYWEHYGLPKEDHDFFCRAVNSGFQLEVVTTPLYYYRLCNTGMMRSNNANRAFDFSVNQIVNNQALTPNKSISKYELQALHLAGISYWCAKQRYYKAVPHWLRQSAGFMQKLPRRLKKLIRNPGLLLR